MKMHKAYTILMTLELASIGIKYQGLNTNPFQQSSSLMLLFLTALFCHVVATIADMSSPTTMIIFHFSGLVGCETLLWILLPEFWKCCIINLFLLVVTSFCFFNSIHNITTFYLTTHSSATKPPSLEPQEAQA
ncbi:hypothetical protein MtrunA17_Chr3g0103561 [Medicago truncatula]|uniref:Transmembrane protein, putative n=1 Tax=Medicago truncatula TaxID=3880 RepID=G7J281_MEDTR|nr:transmembrane protein, putative [Medicago truncatula]RHN67519.1 hypothetical protein MtrunA17_Chr3g0103561 [Medicago truncatula]